MTQKKIKRTEFSSFEVLDVFFWGMKASPVAWESFMEALGIGKLQFLIKKIKIKFLVVSFFNFRSSNLGSGSGIRIRN